MKNAIARDRRAAVAASPTCHVEGCEATSSMALQRAPGDVVAVCWKHHAELLAPPAPPPASGTTFERRRPDRLNASESDELERLIRRHGTERVMGAMGVATTTLDNLRHSGPATKATIERVRAGLAKGMP